MVIPAWIQAWAPILLAGAIGYCIGSLRDVHFKLDKLQRQVEHLHNKLYDGGVIK